MLTQFIGKVAKRVPLVRRTHCFCLGAAKTGTTSFASMFQAYYRSAHEAETSQLTVAVENVILEKWQGADVVPWLRARDKRLNLEVEASHPLGYMAKWLPQVFPEARFVITIREPLPWLKSRLNFHYYKVPVEWQSYRHTIWSPWHKGFCPEEKVLEELGLYSLDAYLAQYAEQYKLLFRHLPQDRSIIVKTEQLNSSIEKIADFVGLNPTTITRQHANGFAPETSVIDLLAEDFVAQRIAVHCGWMQTFC